MSTAYRQVWSIAGLALLTVCGVAGTARGDSTASPLLDQATQDPLVAVEGPLPVDQRRLLAPEAFAILDGAAVKRSVGLAHPSRRS
jgi:hypothetical protein